MREIGGQIIGFDEEPTNTARHLRVSTVTNYGTKEDEIFELVLSDGTTLRCNGKHKWLLKRTGREEKRSRLWMSTHEIVRRLNEKGIGWRKPKLRLPRFFTPWRNCLNDRSAGILAGAFDSDGSLSGRGGHGHGLHPYFSQQRGRGGDIVLDEVQSALKVHGFKYGGTESNGGVNKKVQHNLYLHGGLCEDMRFLGEVRPPRLLNVWLDSQSPDGCLLQAKEDVEIISARSLGRGEVVLLGSDAKTYIAEGFGAHNTDDRLGNVSITEDVTQLTNRIYIKDATSKSSEKRVDTFIADGNTSFFRLFSPPYGDEEFKVLIDGLEVTSEIDTLTTQEGEIEGSRDLCFFCIINAGLRFPLNFLPEDGAIVQVEYFPEEGGGDSGLIVVVEDPDSIRMMRQRESVGSFLSDGIHESLVSVPELRVTNLDPLGFLGGLMLDRGAWPEIKGSWETSDTALVGFRPGQSVTLSSSNRNLFSSREYWRRGIKEDIVVHIQSVSKKFVPYNTASGVDMLVTEHVEFSSIPARLAF